MSDSKKLLTKAKEYVQHLFLEKGNQNLVFHNFVHTEEVVEVCEDMLDDISLEDEKAERFLLAAWFLNTGFIKSPHDPIQESADICRRFLEEHDYDAGGIKEVEALIKSTDKEQEPSSELEKMLHDANWSYIGRKRFFRKSELLRLETERINDENYTIAEWDKRMRELLAYTKFYTPWALDEYSSRKHKNVLKQTKNVQKAEKKTRRRKTGKDFGRGIDTLYRNTLRGHLELSAIADGKANMIITINTLVLSLLITAGSASFSLAELRIQENLQFIIPTLVLMISSLLAIIFAVLSAIPKYSSVSIDMEDVKKQKKSLLFFNNFLSVSKDQFVDYLRKLKSNETVLYDNLARDVYNLGDVLKKKYRLLNIAYKVFVGGLALSFVAFFVLLSIYGFR